MNLKNTVLICIFSSFISCGISIAQNKELKVGDTMPFFILKDQNNQDFNNRDYFGKKVMVIYFYPEDESPVCTNEACAFRDSYQAFTDAGAIVIGINYASVETHKKFVQHHQLPFIVLSDPDQKVIKQFGVPKKFFISGRETFVIDLKGKIVFTYNSITQGTKHARVALDYIRKIK